MSRAIAVLGLCLCGVVAQPATSRAFCGFYVSGADGKLFNNATQVVLMREGTRTVLSMRNNYQGPPTDFAMVVPVPTVLQEENVKTLSAAIFDRVSGVRKRYSPVVTNPGWFSIRYSPIRRISFRRWSNASMNR